MLPNLRCLSEALRLIERPHVYTVLGTVCMGGLEEIQLPVTLNTQRALSCRQNLIVSSSKKVHTVVRAFRGVEDVASWWKRKRYKPILGRLRVVLMLLMLTSEPQNLDSRLQDRTPCAQLIMYLWLPCMRDGC